MQASRWTAQRARAAHWRGWKTCRFARVAKAKQGLTRTGEQPGRAAKKRGARQTEWPTESGQMVRKPASKATEQSSKAAKPGQQANRTRSKSQTSQSARLSNNPAKGSRAKATNRTASDALGPPPPVGGERCRGVRVGAPGPAERAGWCGPPRPEAGAVMAGVARAGADRRACCGLARAGRKPKTSAPKKPGAPSVSGRSHAGRARRAPGGRRHPRRPAWGPASQ